MDNRKGSFATYIEDGLWKCDKSPTKAHFWTQFNARDGYGEFLCKWCGETRWFPTTDNTCLEAIGKSERDVPYSPGQNMERLI